MFRPVVCDTSGHCYLVFLLFVDAVTVSSSESMKCLSGVCSLVCLSLSLLSPSHLHKRKRKSTRCQAVESRILWKKAQKFWMPQFFFLFFLEGGNPQHVLSLPMFFDEWCFSHLWVMLASNPHGKGLRILVACESDDTVGTACTVAPMTAFNGAETSDPALVGKLQDTT